jgi:CRP-like cAMP-binding protein
MSATPKPYLYQDLDYLGGAGEFSESVFAAIGQGSLYEQLSRDDCALLCQFMHCFAAPRGAVLLEEGVEGDHLLLVLDGRVRVSKRDVAGRQVDLALVGAGNVLGEMSLIDGEHRFASCVAHEPVRFAVLTRADLNEMLFAHPRLGNKLLIWILQITIGRVREMDLRSMPQAAGPLA